MIVFVISRPFGTIPLFLFCFVTFTISASLEHYYICLFQVDTPCTSACACGQQQNWSTYYTLDFLEEVEIRNFRGSEHDFAFVDMLCGMSTAIKKVAITFHHLASPSELQCTLDIFGTCFEVKYNTSEVLYERPSSLFPETPDDHCV